MFVWDNYYQPSHRWGLLFIQYVVFKLKISDVWRLLISKLKFIHVLKLLMILLPNQTTASSRERSWKWSIISKIHNEGFQLTDRPECWISPQTNPIILFCPENVRRISISISIYTSPLSSTLRKCMFKNALHYEMLYVLVFPNRISQSICSYNACTWSMHCTPPLCICHQQNVKSRHSIHRMHVLG